MYENLSHDLIVLVYINLDFLSSLHLPIHFLLINSRHFSFCPGFECGIGSLLMVFWCPLPISSTPSNALYILLSGLHAVLGRWKNFSLNI